MNIGAKTYYSAKTSENVVKNEIYNKWAQYLNSYQGCDLLLLESLFVENQEILNLPKIMRNKLYNTRNQLLTILKQKIAAATKIQAWHRGNYARKAENEGCPPAYKNFFNEVVGWKINKHYIKKPKKIIQNNINHSGTYKVLTHQDHDYVGLSLKFPKLFTAITPNILEIIKKLHFIIPQIKVNNKLLISPNLGEGTLYDKLKNGLKFDNITSFKDLILELEILHQQNIVHRDIKIENLFFKNNKIYLSDLDSMGYLKSFTNGYRIGTISNELNKDNFPKDKDVMIHNNKIYYKYVNTNQIIEFTDYNGQVNEICIKKYLDSIEDNRLTLIGLYLAAQIAGTTSYCPALLLMAPHIYGIKIDKICLLHSMISVRYISSPIQGRFPEWIIKMFALNYIKFKYRKNIINFLLDPVHCDIPSLSKILIFN